MENNVARVYEGDEYSRVGRMSLNSKPQKNAVKMLKLSYIL